MIDHCYVQQQQSAFRKHFAALFSYLCFCGILFNFGAGQGLLAQEAQKAWKLYEIEAKGIPSRKEKRALYDLLIKAKDSATVEKGLKSWLTTQAENGYLSAELIAWEKKGDVLQVELGRGPWFGIEELTINNFPAAYWDLTGLDRVKRKQGTLDWGKIEKGLNLALEEMQQNGHPFAQVYRTGVAYRQQGRDTVWANISYQFEAGASITIDSIKINGKPREKKAFIHSLMRVLPGDRYNQSLIDNIPFILNNSIYYQKVKAPQLRFRENRLVDLQIELARKQAGKFDLLIGLLPADGTSERFQFTGAADIVLVSTARLGEVLRFKYNKLTSTSQQLEASLQVPYLLGTPLQMEASFSLQNQEQEFLITRFEGGGRYAFSPFLYAKAYFRSRAARLLDSSTVGTGVLPLQADGSHNVFGLGLGYEKLDYRLNPRNGISFEFLAGIGTRRLRENARFNFEQFDIRESQPVREWRSHIRWYKQLFKRQVLHLANYTYWLGQEQYFQNDQVQIGGARSLRGFNENQFFTDLYTYATVEYRLILERDSYLFAFWDQAYLRDKVRQESLFPRGFGLGMNYGTKIGVVSLSYAIGRAEGIPLDATRGKVHIGFINQF